MNERSMFDAIQEAAAEHFAEVLATGDESDDADLIALRAMLSKAAFDRGRAIIENESRTASQASGGGTVLRGELEGLAKPPPARLAETR